MGLNSCTDSRATLLAALVAAGVLLAASAGLKFLDLGGVPRLLVALVPVPFFALMLLFMVRDSRRLDEMMRKVQLEALAVAFGGTALVVLLLGQLQRAEVLGEENLGVVVAVMAGSYLLGYLMALRRYR